MIIFSTQQLREADRLTILKQQIDSLALMERAGEGVFAWLDGSLKGNPVAIHVFCGVGNNGGDGLVVARHLMESGYHVHAYVVDFGEKRSPEFLENLDRIKNLKYWPEHFSGKKGEEFPEIGSSDIVVDAIFGIGLNRRPEAWVEAIMTHINASEAFVLSVDIPSGLYMERCPDKDAVIVKARHTLSFQFPKLIFFLPDTAKYTDSWEVLDIKLDAEYVQNTVPFASLIGKQEVLPMYRFRDKYAHKGTMGHALLVAGSYGKMGAAGLSAKACLHSGAGLVTAYIPRCGYTVLQTLVPEVMTITDTNEDHITAINSDISPAAIGLGPGLGTHRATADALGIFLKQNKAPLVLDADALNIIAARREYLNFLPEDTVLTPHEGELQRLIGEWEDDFDKLNKARAFAREYKLVLVVKGAHTAIFNRDNIFINSTGNPGMATAGSGDVLAGIITGLISQGYTPLQAAIFGVYLHGRAGDIGASQKGYEALTATTLIEFVGSAFTDLFARPAAPAKAAEN
ncbi:NAD(P)H-hydrate dehydratase [Sinomicrobium sp.]